MANTKGTLDLSPTDQQEQSKQRLRDLVWEGLESGPATPVTQAERDELDAIASGEIP